MIKQLLFIAFFAIAALTVVSLSLNNAHSYPEGAPSGAAGAPADNNKTCAQGGCHPGTATPIFNVITSDVPATGYEPGATYTVTATITDPGLVRYGFEITPQDLNGNVLGTMALSDPSKTKFTASNNKYITHKSNGTMFPGHTASWSFNWTAPAAGTGDVTFYGAFDFSNNNGSTSGDVIHTSTLTVSEALGTGIDEIAAIHSLTVFPNPATDHFNLFYQLNDQQLVQVSLCDMSGRQVALYVNETQPAGNYNYDFPLDNIVPGVYVINIASGNRLKTLKLVRM